MQQQWEQMIARSWSPSQWWERDDDRSDRNQCGSCKTQEGSIAMWVFRLITEPGMPPMWTVGYYAPDGTWNADSDHESKISAANRVSFLNGNGRAK